MHYVTHTSQYWLSCIIAQKTKLVRLTEFDVSGIYCMMQKNEHYEHKHVQWMYGTYTVSTMWYVLCLSLIEDTMTFYVRLSLHKFHLASGQVCESDRAQIITHHRCFFQKVYHICWQHCSQYTRVKNKTLYSSIATVITYHCRRSSLSSVKFQAAHEPNITAMASCV